MEFDDDRQEALFTYWKQSRGDKIVPLASDFDPTKIAHLLKDIVIFDVLGDRDIRYRLAGTEVAERLGRDPTGVNLIDLAAPEAQGYISELFAKILSQPTGAIVHYQNTYSTGKRAPVRSFFLPLAMKAGKSPRVLSLHGQDEAPTSYEKVQLSTTVGTLVEKVIWLDLGAGTPAPI